MVHMKLDSKMRGGDVKIRLPKNKYPWKEYLNKNVPMCFTGWDPAAQLHRDGVWPEARPQQLLRADRPPAQHGQHQVGHASRLHHLTVIQLVPDQCRLAGGHQARALPAGPQPDPSHHRRLPRPELPLQHHQQVYSYTVIVSFKIGWKLETSFSKSIMWGVCESSCRLVCDWWFCITSQTSLRLRI